MYDKNFSLWCDFLERDFLAGEFLELVRNGVINGVTSNPSIFKNAILNSKAYEKSKKKFQNLTPKKLYENLATSDIRTAACGLLRNFVDNDDGFVSIEVDPNLSKKALATFKEGKGLYSAIGMPNVMIKVPATKAGFEAMKMLISRGISVNATLIFSPEQTKNCLDAFKAGIKEFKENFENANLPKAVISIFVSRFDRALNDDMKRANLPVDKVGIYNATKCYNIIKEAKLSFVKPLFASTGVKGGDLKADYYITELLFENCVNTAPLETIKEFIKSSHEVKTPLKTSEIDKFFAKMKENKIDIEKTYKILLNDGLKQFEIAFGEIIEALKKD